MHYNFLFIGLSPTPLSPAPTPATNINTNDLKKIEGNDLTHL